MQETFDIEGFFLIGPLRTLIDPEGGGVVHFLHIQAEAGSDGDGQILSQPDLQVMLGVDEGGGHREVLVPVQQDGIAGEQPFTPVLHEIILARPGVVGVDGPCLAAEGLIQGIEIEHPQGFLNLGDGLAVMLGDVGDKGGDVIGKCLETVHK